MNVQNKRNLYPISILEVNLVNIKYNYSQLKKYSRLKNNNTKIGAVLKANAYGCGAIEVSKALLEVGCEIFFVATLDEAVELRINALKDTCVQIYMLNSLDIENIEIYKKYNIIPVCASAKHIELCKKADINFAIQLDTGLCRLGVKFDDLDDSMISDNCKMLISQYVSSDNPDSEISKKQYEILLKVKEQYPLIPVSGANSGGINWGPDKLFNVVRVGRALYGTCCDKFACDYSLKPVLSWRIKIVHKQIVPGQCGVGYDHMEKTYKQTLIATIGAGYVDGIPIDAYDREMCAVVEREGKIYRLPFFGRTSMDLSMLNIDDAPWLEEGDYIYILNENQTIDSLTQKIKYNPRQFISLIGMRVKREYIVD